MPSPVRNLTLPVFVACCLASMVWASRGYEPRLKDPFESPSAWTVVGPIEIEGLRCFEVAADGTIWLGFLNGIASFDGREQRFHPELTARGLRKIYAASDGKLYVSASRSLWVFDGENWRRYPKTLRFPRTSDVGVCEDPAGGLWIAADRGIYRVGEESLHRVGPTFEHPIADFDIDREGNFWLLESDAGSVRLLRLEGSDLVEAGFWPGLANIPVGPDGEAPRVLSDIFCADDGSVWVANGMDSVAPKQLRPGSEQWITHDLTLVGGTNASSSISQTSDGVLRITGAGAIHTYDSGHWRVVRPPTLHLSSQPLYVDETPAGDVLVLERFVRMSRIDYARKKWRTYQGLAFQDEEADGSVWFLADDHSVVRKEGGSDFWFKETVEDGLIEMPTRVFVRSNGEVWVTGSHRGSAAAAVLSDLGWTIVPFDPLGVEVVSGAVAEASDGTLFLGGAVFEEGRKPWETQPVALVPRSPQEATRFARIPFRTIHEATRLPDGRVAVGSDDIYVWQGERFESLLGDSRESLESNEVQRFEVMENGDVWVLRNRNGLVRLRDGKWTPFGEADGMSSRDVVDLAVFKSGQLAALTPEGVERFDGEGWYTLRVPDLGVLSGRPQLLETPAGIVWINTGFFRRSATITNAYAISYTPGNSYPNTELKLLSNFDPYARSMFFGWTGSDSELGSFNRSFTYSYRLKGEEWSPYSEQNTVFLQDLPQGPATFEVRARNENGAVDPTPAVFDFEIRAPFWETAWFRFSLGVMVLALLGMAFGLLVQRIRHVAALDRMRTRFLTHISHELRSPLTLIMGPLEKLASLNPKGSASEVAALTALRNAKRLNELVDQLLELRRVEEDLDRRVIEVCELVELTRLWASDFDQLAQSAGQRVEFASDAASEWLAIDKDAYRKVLDNLVMNALKHSEVGAVTRIRLKTTNAENPKCRNLELSVSDQGTGISKEDLPRIFDAFYSDHAKGFHGVRSFGVGLALVKELVEKQGGRISVASPCGNRAGACFNVELFGLARGSEGAAAQAVTDERDAKPEAAGRVDLHLVLLVDDNREIREFLADQLRVSYRVIEASNGQEALVRARNEIPSLVLADVVMPGMTGLELCEALRKTEATSHIPVILLTASGNAETQQAGLESGAIDFVSKPFSVSALMRKIDNLLANRELFAKRMKVKLLEGSGGDEENPEEAFVRKVKAVLESNLADPNFSAAVLAARLGFGRTSFHRKMMAVLNASPGSFIKSYRLERSLAMLANGVTASEAALKIGYVEASSFSRSFKKHFGHTPANFKKVFEEKGSVLPEV